MPASVELFRWYPNNVFVETGTFHGTGVEFAIAAGFTKIKSVELSHELASECKDKFRNTKFVEVIEGDSAVVLPSILAGLTERATFWLDGHFSHCETACGPKVCPILDEIEAISMHHIKNHTILVDDVRLFGTEEFGMIKLQDVVTAIRRINDRYVFRFHDGETKSDVMAAFI